MTDVPQVSSGFLASPDRVSESALQWVLVSRTAEFLEELCTAAQPWALPCPVQSESRDGPENLGKDFLSDFDELFSYESQL